MGAAGIVATLAGRPRSRWYAVLLAAAVTLGAQPARERRRRLAAQLRRRDRDPAVGGVARCGTSSPAAPRRLAARARRGRRRDGRGDARHGAADGARLRRGLVASLPANLLALPAVAPVMWLGMLACDRRPGARAAGASRSPGSPACWPPTSPRSHTGSARRAGRASSVPLAARRRCWPRTRRSAWALGGAWLGRAGDAGSAGRPPSQGGARPRWPSPGRASSSGRPALGRADPGQPDAGPARHRARRRPGRRDPAPARRRRAGARGRRAAAATSFATNSSAMGVSELAAAVVTHDQSDHVGRHRGAARRRSRSAGSSTRERGPRLPSRRAGRGRCGRSSIAEGSEIDSGALRLEALWPPRAAARGPGPADPNRWPSCCSPGGTGFSMLLTADAEAEAVPIDPGPVDVLKVAHHGSDDAGLAALLDRTAPAPRGDLGRRRQPLRSSDRGHARHPRRAPRAPVLRTDEGGDVAIDVAPSGWRVEAGSR